MENITGEWEIHTSKLKITTSEIVLIPITKLKPHPDNRPLGANQEKIEQLKILLLNNGFDSSHPLVVRPTNEELEAYQIIEGEHRFQAARALGFIELPCVIRELNDVDALIQLILGNVQTENKPLEIGLNALKVLKQEAYKVVDYAKRLGLAESTLRRYIHASEVFEFVKTQVPEGVSILEEVYKLEEIYKCPKSDWIWLHNLTQKNEISRIRLKEVAQTINEIQTKNAIVYELLDLISIRQEIAEAYLKGNKKVSDTYKDLLRSLEDSYNNLEENILMYEYDVLTDHIKQEEINLKDWFVSNLKELKNITKQVVLESYKDALQLKRSATQAEAERDMAYFRDKKHSKERAEQEKVERAMREVKVGEWWRLGNHFLYCGESNEPAFLNKLPEKVQLAFIRPPFVAQIADEEGNLSWQYDFLGNFSQIVAVTPELQELQTLLKTTQMPYQWSLACEVDYQIPKAEGLGSWIYTALFSKGNIDKKIKDHWQMTIDTPNQYLPQDFWRYLIDSFTKTHDIIIDCEAGEGNAFLIAEEETRICYGAEKNPNLCKEILENWETISKEKAMRVSGL